LGLKVIISGASSGIGKALAEEYSRKGATVGLIARRRDILEKLKKSLPVESHIYSIDVNDVKACQAMAKHFIHNVGIPDIIIANAGISHGTLTEHGDDLETFKKIVQTNLFGMVNLFQPFVGSLKSQNKGSLVGISSVAGIRGLPGASAYSCSKAAVSNYLEALRIEVAEFKISVTNIAPGYIYSEMTQANPYPMPFIMDTNNAAKKMIQAIHFKKQFVIIPWQMAIFGKIMQFLPNFIWDRLAKNGPRKPRKSN